MIRLFLCGDVMTGRGIDQILPYPSNPVVYEPYVDDAREYIEIAEEKNGKIPRPVGFDYIWGGALSHLERFQPAFRIINLETSITSSDDYWRGKGINYRMNPKNIPCLTAGKIDCCALANNHVLDWGYSGLYETLETLSKVGIKTSGAGKSLVQAESPAILEANSKGRVLFFSFASETSGLPPDWGATPNQAGVSVLKEHSSKDVKCIKALVEKFKQPNDVVLVSIHWGGNWGYEVPSDMQSFAHALIDKAGVDLIHGHSSHHPKGIEVYKNKLILYGCGDFLNDYEGIRSFEDFRGDLGLMYFPTVDQGTGELSSLEMVPTQIKHFKVNNASAADWNWLCQTLSRECEKFGCQLETEKNRFELKWR